tara:strand:+ start:769 stop:1596 length:828 start_codon:yes stop_codon:yes gene_type:complete
MNDQERLDQLKEILLSEDRKIQEKIDSNIKELNQLFSERERLEEKVGPLIDDHIKSFEKDIPRKLGPSITAALQKQINDSQNEVVDLLYPIIGKLISKFIRIEIQHLAEKIDDQLSNAFSIDGWIKRIKAWFGGVSETEVILRDVAPPKLEEIFLIESGSGILINSYSNNQTIDRDMIAGMMTAIKSFVEDAFKGGQQDLEVIQYESYKIQLYSFKSYYLAIVISGVINAEFLFNLQNTVLEFADSYKSYSKTKKKQEGVISEDLTPLLKEFFSE